MQCLFDEKADLKVKLDQKPMNLVLTYDALLQNRAIKPVGGWNPEDPAPIHEDEGAKAMRIWSRYQAVDDSPIYDVFAGLTRSSITCHKCMSVTTSYEPCLDLSLPLAKEPKASLSKWFSSTNTCTTIVDCLQAFFGDEELQVTPLPPPPPSSLSISWSSSKCAVESPGHCQGPCQPR